VTKVASADAAVKVEMVVAGRVMEGTLFQHFAAVCTAVFVAGCVAVSVAV